MDGQTSEQIPIMYKNRNKQKDPNNLAGEWESVYELDSLQKSLFPWNEAILLRNSLKLLKTSDEIIC